MIGNIYEVSCSVYGRKGLAVIDESDTADYFVIREFRIGPDGNMEEEASFIRLMKREALRFMIKIGFYKKVGKV